jgi:hypothetical protein
MILEDTIIDHPILPEFGPGPMEVVRDFFAENDSFAIDVTRKKFFRHLIQQDARKIR